MADDFQKTSFFTALSGSCRGTDIYFRLMHQHPLRAVWHLLLLLLLCGAAATLVQVWTVGEETDAAFAQFKAVFGGVSVTDGRIVRPELRPGDSRSQLLPGGGILSYVPDHAIPALPEKTAITDFHYLVYWFPTAFVMARRLDDSTLAVGVIRPGRFPGQQRIVDEKGFHAILADAVAENARALDAAGDRARRQGGAAPVSTLSSAELATSVKLLWSGMNFLFFVVGNFFQSVICSALFAGMFLITGARRLRVLNGRQLLVTTLYAGFPPLAAATLIPALDLPLITFGMAYMIGMVIYLLIIVQRIEQSAGGTAGKPEE